MFKAYEDSSFEVFKVPKAKALRLMTLMRLLVNSSFVFEYGSSSVYDLVLIFQKGLKNSLKNRDSQEIASSIRSKKWLACF